MELYLLLTTGLLALIPSASALYFHLGETEKKCFMEEIPDETMVVGKSNVLYYDARNWLDGANSGRSIGKYKVEFLDVNSNQYVQVPPGMGMHVEVKDPDQKLIMGRTYGAEGKFTFTSHTPGEHTMCLSTNSSRWFGGSSLVRPASLALQYGIFRTSADDFTQIVKWRTVSFSLPGWVRHFVKRSA